MSICSNTLRASSRWRVPASKTLLPFLYQTPTIQQWKPAAQRIAHRNASSRSNHDNDIPFEDETLPTPVNQVESSRKTTITGSERAAFEKLYKKFNAQGRPQDDNHHEPELDQIADEYYEDDDDGSTVSLDSLFDAVLQNSSYLRETSPRKPNPNLKKNKGLSLTAVAENMVHPALDRVKEQSRNLAQADAAALKLRMMQERTRVNTMIRNAQTDREVWEVLDREVFAVVRTLDLDNLRKSVKTASGRIKSKMQDTYLAKEAEKYKISLPRFSGLPPDNPQSPPRLEASVSDPRIFFPNYPHHIVVAVQTLRKSFPTSPLPLYILPIIKSLGRSSYALGATTDLYKQLLYNAWLQHSSYSQIDSLLTDMDNGGIEFDANILRLLDLILAEYQRARIGRYGRTLQLVLGTEQYEEGRKKLQIWRETIASRLGDWASSRPQRRTLVRKVDPLAKDKSFTRHVGPRDEISFRTSQKRRESSKGKENRNLLESMETDATQRIEESGLSTAATEENRERDGVDRNSY